eukprot:scaffold32657_cov31-Tisochrysis_lutea.AAC.2
MAARAQVDKCKLQLEHSVRHHDGIQWTSDCPQSASARYGAQTSSQPLGSDECDGELAGRSKSPGDKCQGCTQVVASSLIALAWYIPFVSSNKSRSK